MKRSTIIILTISFTLLFSASAIFAGIGDGKGPFDDGSEEDNSIQGIGTTESSSSSLFGDDMIQADTETPGDAEDPIGEVPLDGGTSILLLSGAAWGISKIRKKKIQDSSAE